MATVSRLLKIIGLLCRISSLFRVYQNKQIRYHGEYMMYSTWCLICLFWYTLKKHDILQKRPIVLRSLLTVATPYVIFYMMSDLFICLYVHLFIVIVYMILYFSRSREVGGWGRDPKKCTGRDWGMGSSTIQWALRPVVKYHLRRGVGLINFWKMVLDPSPPPLPLPLPQDYVRVWEPLWNGHRRCCWGWGPSQ